MSRYVTLIDEESASGPPESYVSQFIHCEMGWPCMSCRSELRDCAQDTRSSGSPCCDDCLHKYERDGDLVR